MARMIRTAISRKERSGPVAASSLSPEARQHMIGEAAYYRYTQRGFSDGHALDDWLAAEAQFERARRRQPAPESEPEMDEELGMQHGGAHGPAEDDALKRIVRQHPRRDIPRMESIEPEDAPPRQ